MTQNLKLVKLMQIKSILVTYIDKLDFDADAIEYLLDVIDYLISGKIAYTKEVLNVILEDTLVTSTFHKDKCLLKVVTLLTEMIEEKSLCMR